MVPPAIMLPELGVKVLEVLGIAQQVQFQMHISSLKWFSSTVQHRCTHAICLDCVKDACIYVPSRVVI